MSAAESPDSDDKLMKDAASWLARQRGPDAATTKAAFEAWMKADPRHRAFYARAAEIVAMGKWLGESERSPRTAAPARRLLPLLAALILLVAASLLVIPRLLPGGAPRPAIASADDRLLATGPGQIRMARLADGSRIRLAPGSRLAVRLDARGRRLELRRGSARFEVFHEPRPFIVRAGGGRIIARGTMFDVALEGSGQVTVRLLEGRVDVSVPGETGLQGATAGRRLQPGESVTFAAVPEAASSAGRALPSAADHPEVLIADLIASANRRSSRPIRLADPQIGANRLSGRFSLADTSRLAERLADLLGLEADLSSPHEIVLRRR